MKKNKSTSGKLNIGLDLDGVIINHAQNKKRLAKSLGFKIKTEETASEIFEKILPPKKYKKLQRMIYGKLTLKAPPMPFSLKTIKDLSSKYNLHIISRRENPKIPLNWLKKYRVLKNIPPEDIFFVKEEGQKNRVVKNLKINIYLDDKVKVLKSLPAVPHRIFFNPRRISTERNFLEINSWKEFPELLEKLKRT